ncbi:hypothetical protein DFH06DRAFT_1200126 [Mycena polygramma]|nr:hypothetical protein DFH06DRAFT_1200126 [Mycena polygramma]
MGEYASRIASTRTGGNGEGWGTEKGDTAYASRSLHALPHGEGGTRRMQYEPRYRLPTPRAHVRDARLGLTLDRKRHLVVLIARVFLYQGAVVHLHLHCREGQCVGGAGRGGGGGRGGDGGGGGVGGGGGRGRDERRRLHVRRRRARIHSAMVHTIQRKHRRHPVRALPLRHERRGRHTRSLRRWGVALGLVHELPGGDVGHVCGIVIPRALRRDPGIDLGMWRRRRRLVRVWRMGHGVVVVGPMRCRCG